MLEKKPYPLVTCVTTTYRKFQFLYETINSVLMQTYPNIEMVICDDGSENFPQAEIENYIALHKRDNIKSVVIEHSETNHGTVFNCRRCRELASGTYIMGIASDDYFYDKDVISDVVDFFEKTGADIVACKRQFIDANSKEKLAVFPTKKQQSVMNTRDCNRIFNEIASFCFLSGANTYYRKTFYEKYGGYDSSFQFMEDYPFYLRILRSNELIYFYDRISINYRFGAGSSTTAHKKNVLRKAMYEDRIRYMEQEILPFMDHMEWWRKQQMYVRLKRFQIEQNTELNNVLAIYIKLFFYSPIGTLVHVFYQGKYKLSTMKRI